MNSPDGGVFVRHAKNSLRAGIVAARLAVPVFDIQPPIMILPDIPSSSGWPTHDDGQSWDLSDHQESHGERAHGKHHGVGRKLHENGIQAARVVFSREHKRGRPRGWLVSPGSVDSAPYGAWNGGGEVHSENNVPRSFSDTAIHAKTIATGLASLTKDDWAQTPPGFAGLKHDLRVFDDLSVEGKQHTIDKLKLTLSFASPAPDGWVPATSSTEEQEQLNRALMMLAEAGLGAAGALGFVYQLGKHRRKALPALFAFAALTSACGGNIAETATVVFGGGQQTTTEQAPTQTQMLTPETPAPTELFGSGGGDQTCEAAAASFLAPRMSPEGAIVPIESMVQHSPDPNKWTENEKRALVDSNGNSIAPLIDGLKDQIEAINPSVRTVAVWSSSEGYVLQLQKIGKDVWAVARNGLFQYRPDLLVDNILGVSEGDTDEFRILPDPPVDGEKRYVVTGGCGVLGVFDKKSGKMIAMYKPLTNTWVELTGDNAAQEAFSTSTAPETPEQLATVTPFPSPEPTAIPTVEPTILSADEQFGPPLQDALKAAGVTMIDCALPNAALWDALVKGGVMQQVKFLDGSLLNLLKRFMQADGTITLPDAVTKFHCGFSQRQDGVMEPQWYLVTEKGVTIFLLSDDGNTLIRGELRGGVPVPLLENGRVVVVTPPPSNGGVQPTPGAQEPPPVVNPPDNQQNLTPQPENFPVTLEGYGTLNYRDNMYVCAPCGYNADLASKSKNPNLIQVIIRVRDPATLKWIEAETEQFNGDSVVNAEAKINTLVGSGYKRLATNWGQTEDPRKVGVHPHTVTIILEHP